MPKHKNSLKIEGFLSDDPKTIPMGQKKKVRFTLEVCDEWNGRETKQYFVVDAFGKAADKFLDHRTGDHVQFTGQVAQNAFTRKNGEQVNEVVLKALEYGWKVWNNNNQNDRPQSRPQNNAPNRWESDEEEAF